ncbi:MAG TPA: holo-ACP synthase [Bacilli bacterium]|nr:holo-ACP synthase [Bacilli bacterium]
MAIGVDIVFIPRLIDKDDVARRILSAREYAEYEKRTHKAEFLAGRFAAKEAFLKASNNLIGKQALKTIEITVEPGGKPVLTFQGKTYDVSIAHDGDYAIAICQINE